MNQKEWSRRKFLSNVTAAGSLLVINSHIAWSNEQKDSKVKRIVSSIIGVDAHNHIDVPFNIREFKEQKYDLAAELKSSGLIAICMTFCVDRPNLNKEGEAFDRFITSLNEMDELLKNNAINRALNYSDVLKARKENAVVVIQSVEGGHFIEGKIERIQLAYNRGLRHLGLMHDNQSSPPIGDIYTDAPQFGGLTDLGINIIKECNRLGILVDLTHCDNKTIQKAVEVSTRPMIISHTGLNTQLGSNENTAKMMMPRLITKEQAKLFAQTGGVIGVWTHLADSPLEYAKNIRAMVDVVGIDYVCIGTDSKMALANNTNDRFGKKTNESWEGTKQGFLYAVVDSLLSIGFTEKEIQQIGGGNYCRVFDQATRL